MAEHARLSPSNLRWPVCPGSVREEAAYPDIPGEAAIDGTGTHLLLEICITQNIEPAELVGSVIGVNHEDKPAGWLVCKERADRVKDCIAYIDRRYDELSAEYPDLTVKVEAETRSDPGGMFGRDDWYGTTDITISVVDEDQGRTVYIEVVDYKDGRGWVEVENNTQLLSYLGGKMRPHVASGPNLVRPFYPERLDGVRMTVVQPKTNPKIRYWEPSPSEAMKYIEQLAWRAHQTDREDAPLVPGKHCQWCKHKPNCSEQSAADIEKVKTMTNEVVVAGGTSLFETIEQTFGDVTTMETEKLVQLADAEDGIRAVFDRVRAEIERRLEVDINSVPGYTLAPGRGTNVWAVPEEEVVKVLRSRKFTKDDIYPPKLISPAQVLKSPKLTDDQKKRIERDYIVHKAGNLQLKKVARKAPTAVDFFGDVVNQEQPTAATTNDTISFL